MQNQVRRQQTPAANQKISCMRHARVVLPNNCEPDVLYTCLWGETAH